MSSKFVIPCSKLDILYIIINNEYPTRNVECRNLRVRVGARVAKGDGL